MMRALLALTTLAAIAAAIALARALDEPPRRSRPSATPQRTPSATATPVRTPAPPRLSREQINRQDRATAAQRARETRVFDTRPLLDRLPLTREGVRIDIAGLAPDDRTTVLAIDPGSRSRTHARHVYRELLARAGDSGRAYVLEWTR